MIFKTDVTVGNVTEMNGKQQKQITKDKSIHTARQTSFLADTSLQTMHPVDP